MAKKNRDDPEIIAEVGGLVDETGVCLGVYGPDLEPDDVTERLRCQPTSSHRRGERQTSDSKAYDLGAWLLEVRGEAPTGPEQLIRRLLMKLPVDQAVWDDLSSRFDVQLRIAVHFTLWNKGFDLSSEVVGLITRIRASLGFDLYGYSEEDA